MVAKSQRQGSEAKVEGNFCSGVNGYKLKDQVVQVLWLFLFYPRNYQTVRIVHL